MLKQYFDRDSSISKPITVVNAVPQESNVFEPEVNSDFIYKSDPGPSKLENSDILRNLNNKLSHFEPSQQEELKQLIHEYEHLFPDIPTRTDNIYHDVSSVYMGILRQPSYPHLPSFFFLNQNQDHFFKYLKNHKQLSYIIRLLHHMI